MADALIGYTGFVGGNLAAQHHFDGLYNSKNIEEIRGREFDLMIVSAMPAAMWIANRDPAADRAVLDRLLGNLREVKAKRVVIMSTVAVYPTAIGVNEDSAIDEPRQTPYGRHRLMLEHELAQHFPQTHAIRLPGLFGPGLKKNAVYDLIHNNEIHKIHCESVYQFYNLNRTWDDVCTVMNSGLPVVNFATEPVSMKQVAKVAFDLDFTNTPETPPARYDMRTKYAGVFGGSGEYMQTAGEVLAQLRDFVRVEIQNRAS